MKIASLKNNRILIICIYALAFVLMTLSFNSQAQTSTEAAPVAAPVEPAAAPPADTAAEPADAKKPAAPAKKAAAKPAASVKKDVKPKLEGFATITTNLGKIVLKLNGEKAPGSVQNFLDYIDKKHYDETIFHRVIPTFMIQGGGHAVDMTEKPTGSPINNEAKNGLSNKKGSVAMARMTDPHSATAQFFINVADNQRLDYKNDSNYGYAVFGEVTQGMDIVEKIKAVKTKSVGPYDDVPVEPVVIKSIRRGKN